HGGAELERELLDTLTECVPRVEAVLSGDNRLRVVKRERRARQIGLRLRGQRRKDPKTCEGFGLSGASRAEQVFGLSFELFEIRACGQLLGCHTTSMLNADGPQAGQHADTPPVVRVDPGDPV